MTLPAKIAPSSAPVAYLTSMYPKASHTFIQREIACLEAAGLRVLPCSIRTPPQSELTGPEEAADAARTFFVIDAAKTRPWRLFAAHIGWLVRAPRRYVRAFGLALGAGPKNAFYRALYFAEAGLLADHLRRQRVRHIHNHLANGSCTVAMAAAKLLDIPFSFTIHGPDDFFTPYETNLATKIARARFVICISHFCRSQCMIFAAPEDWAKLTIMHCGVTPERYAGDRTKAGAPGILNLIFVGRLAGHKGEGVLIDALAALVDDHPGLSLTLVGDGPGRAAAEARAAALKLGERVRFTGYLSQDGVAAELARADALVLPSFAEGVPIVLMEAMAANLPVISTRIAGIPELVEDGVSGFLTPPGDAESLARALAALAADPELRIRMGRAGRARIKAEFTIETEARTLIALLGGGGAQSGA